MKSQEKEERKRRTNTRKTEVKRGIKNQKTTKRSTKTDSSQRRNQKIDRSDY